MFTHIALLSLLTLPGPTADRAASWYRPKVEVWTSRGDDPYQTGQAVRVFYRTDFDAYVTIFRVDTDGRVRVLFPREPWEDNFARGGRDYEMRDRYDRDAFYVDDYAGVGYLFAVASADPFTFDAIESGDHWDYRAIVDGRITGDPYVALTDVARRILPPDYSDWDYDVTPYYVERHYDYPRFLCYDCHTYVSYPYWSPYDYTCVRFRIVVYDDPYYYPYRYYGGTQVVFTRPYRPEPRFIFKDRGPSDGFLTRVRERPITGGGGRDIGVRGRDLGGTGIIPPPPRQQPDIDGGRRRQEPEHPDRPDRRDRPDRPDRPDPPDRPDQPDRRERPDNPQNPDRPRPDRRDRPDRPDRPDRRERPDRPDRHDQPGQVERPRAQPSEPRPEPRVERRPEPPPPRSEPRAEPKREQPTPQPELTRRRPDKP